MSRSYIITPSILSADFTRLGDEIAQAEAAGADWIHVDVMDGHFVPNLTMGPFIVEACRRATKLPIDIHLMVENPERLIEPFARAGASLLYVHVENNPNIYRTIQEIHHLGCKAGVVLNPGTPASSVASLLHLAEIFLVMTVNPGYSGQAFIPEVTPKIRTVRKMLDESNPEAMIAVDGGITETTLPQVIEAGAQVFVASTAIYKHPEGVAAGIRALRLHMPA